jgi:opacity protein-like surface antigen
MTKHRLHPVLRELFSKANLSAAGRSAALALCLIAGGHLARAQRLPTAVSPGASVSVGGTYSYFQAQYPQVDVGGAGAYVDLNFRRQIGLEFEGRFLRRGEVGGSKQSTYLAGPRIEFHRKRFSPYFKGLVGAGELTFPYTPDYYGNFLVVAGGAGLDINVTDNLKLRLIDFEYQRWPEFNFGVPGSNYPISPYGITAGLSYRVYNPSGWRRHRYK